MPKMKTKSSAKKRFKFTSKGRIKVKQAKTSHMMINKSQKMKRKARGTTTLCKADETIVKKAGWMPYGG
ncbi:MAG: 50S ribosomal protein L35 [Alphaproteobacteria bacterium]